MKVLKGYTDKIRLLTLPVLPLLMSLALMMMVVIGVNTTAVVANAQCSVYTFNGITGQLDCVTASGVNVITFAADGNERMRITQGGNVLVGTTTDDGVNLFQVDGSAAFATSVQTPIWNDVTLASGIFSRAGTLGLSATGANVVTVSTNGVERFRVTDTASGARGGTALAFWDSGNADFAYIKNPGSDAATQGLLYLAIGSGGHLFKTYSGSAIDAVTIKPNGNVLIGTTTDDGSSKLQVAGVITTNGAGGGVQINTRNSGANWTQYVNAGTLTLYNGSADIFTLSSAGTATLYNQTATTGVTSFVVRAGAGQSTTNLITLQYNGGTEVTGIRTDQTTWVQNIHHFGSSLSTSDVRVTLGNARSGNGNSYIDLITDATYTTYGLRILRDNAGANGDSSILHRGTGVLSVNAFDAGSVDIKANNTSRLKVNNTGIGFFGVTPVARQTATADAASILALLQAYGLSN